MYRHLLVPLDDTDRSIETVSAAIALARELGARITFFHAQRDHAASLFGEGGNACLVVPSEFSFGHSARTGELLAKAESAARAQGVSCDSCSSISNTAFQAILDAAQRCSCDLIFIGSPGKDSEDGMVLGSQTLKLLMHSDIPVLVAANNKPSQASRAIALIRDEHRSIAAVLHAWQFLIQQIQQQDRAIDIPLMQAMQHYILTFPVALHHPKEDDYLFRTLRARTSTLNAELDELERQHQRDRQLANQLTDTLQAFAAGNRSLEELGRQLDQYARFMWEHLGREEGVIMPAAQRYLREEDWAEINSAFAGNHDPRFGSEIDSEFRQLFTRIVQLAKC